MKRTWLILALMVSLSSLFAQNKELNRAKQGDMVWLIVNHIKNESKTDYLNWMNTHFLPVLVSTLDENTKKQYQHTRWLEPAQQNPDNTWTYVFIMDPVIPKANYDISALLATTYGTEKAAVLYKEYESFFAKPTEAHILKQTRH
jgi:hypothetical protein